MVGFKLIYYAENSERRKNPSEKLIRYNWDKTHNKI
jgi:hypothetical protein